MTHLINIQHTLTLMTAIYMIVITFGIVAIWNAHKAIKRIRTVDSAQITIKRYKFYIMTVAILVLWYFLTIINLISNNEYISLVCTRLAFAIIPWGIWSMVQIFASFIEKIDRILRLLLNSFSYLTLLMSSLILVDTQMINDLIRYTTRSSGNILLFSYHLIIFIGLMMAIVLILLFSMIRGYKKVETHVIRERLNIIVNSFLATLLMIILFSFILPFLGHPELIDFGVLGSLFLMFGLYIALEDKWVYSLHYLISTNIIIWLIGAILFASVKAVELIMAHLFKLDLTDIHDYNAIALGLLMGIAVAYLLDSLHRFSHNGGLKIFYYKFYKFNKEFDKLIYESISLQKYAKLTIINILRLIKSALQLEEVCIYESNALYSEDYFVCSDSKIKDYKTIVSLRGVTPLTLKLSRSRKLILITKNHFVPREFLEVIQKRRSHINALINLDITDRNLKQINTRLARAVVSRTKKLDLIILKQKQALINNQLELARYKSFIPEVVKNIGIATQSLQQYAKTILKELQGNLDLQFAGNKLYDNTLYLKRFVRQLVIFSDVIINHRITKHRQDFRHFLEDELAVWKLRFDNKMIGLIEDLFTEHVNVNADYEKLKFAIDTLLQYILEELLHGYIQVIGRIEGSYIRMQFVVHVTGSRGTAPVNLSPERVEIMHKNLFLISRIIKLHKGSYRQVFSKGYLSFVEFTLPLIG